jgi:hypothetical protein
MPITPDLPFPKSAGDAIRSKDWNDLLTETQRLDKAKLDIAGGAITGPLTIAAALAVGTTSPGATAKLHVVDPNSPAALRIQSTKSFGQAQVEFWSDPQGSGTEWRPGLIQSLDTSPGTFTGGLGFFTNGTGAANRTGQVEAMRIVNGNVGIGSGVNPSKAKLQVNGAVGNTVGLFGGDQQGMSLVASWPTLGFNCYFNAGWKAISSGWTGIIDVDQSTGSMSFHTEPAKANAADAALTVPTRLSIRADGNIDAAGRVRDQKIRSFIFANNSVNTTSTGWANIPLLSLVVNVPVAALFQIVVQINGVQATGGNIGVQFQLVVDGSQWDYTRQEFHNNGWELRGVMLSRIASLGAGSHTISVQWAVTGGTVTCSWYGDHRQIHVIEL